MALKSNIWALADFLKFIVSMSLLTLNFSQIQQLWKSLYSTERIRLFNLLMEACETSVPMAGDMQQQERQLITQDAITTVFTELL